MAGLSSRSVGVTATLQWLGRQATPVRSAALSAGVHALPGDGCSRLRRPCGPSLRRRAVRREDRKSTGMKTISVDGKEGNALRRRLQLPISSERNKKGIVTDRSTEVGDGTVLALGSRAADRARPDRTGTGGEAQQIAAPHRALTAPVRARGRRSLRRPRRSCDRAPASRPRSGGPFRRQAVRVRPPVRRRTRRADGSSRSLR